MSAEKVDPRMLFALLSSARVRPRRDLPQKRKRPDDCVPPGRPLGEPIIHNLNRKMIDHDSLRLQISSEMIPNASTNLNCSNFETQGHREKLCDCVFQQHKQRQVHTTGIDERNHIGNEQKTLQIMAFLINRSTKIILFTGVACDSSR